MSTLDEIIRRRQRLLPTDTTAFRLMDGTETPGLFIDYLDGRLLVSLRDRGIPAPLRRDLEASGRTVYLKHLERDNKLAPQHLMGPKEESPRFEILEQGLRFMMDMDAGYSQGIFLDQRDNRAELRKLCRPGMQVLNTFSYTGAFSVYAAAAGATTTTLDLAQPCLDWCKENMQLNGIAPEEHYFCKGDTLHWLRRFAKQGRRFDIIILDPPTFSRDDKGKIWRVERDYGTLVALAMEALAPGGRLLATTNCRKLSPAGFRALVAEGAPGANLSARPMPVDFDGEDYLKSLWVES